ncbi:hypothetical protein ACFWCB_01670 [Streptomyces sp. NPDC060048]|uniref:hypothetical protein n=1 Tax=unclassified Streptomyces TaxID=2593676 RepID=UPI00367B6D38
MAPTSHANGVRASYDAVAADYARLLAGELERKPLDRAVLAAFAVLGGVLAWYFTVHTPPSELAPISGEFARVPAPGGYVLIAFKAGDGQIRLERAYGHPVELDVYWTPPDHIAALLAGAGLTETARLIRAPGDSEKSPQGFLPARKAS